MDTAQIDDALRKSGGSVRAAAEVLGVPRRTLDRKITERGLRSAVAVERNRGGGRPKGPKGPTGPKRCATIDPANRVKVERECDAGEEFISLADGRGNMVTIKFVACGSGSARGDGRGRLADLIMRPDGRAQTEFISAEIQASCAEERRRYRCLESAIGRVCGPAMAARVQEEMRKT